MKLKTLLSMLFVSSFLAACYNDKLEDLHPKLNKSCDSTAISYAKQVTSVMNNYCTSCHNSNNKGGGINLDNYADVKAQGVTGKLLSSVIWDGNASKMPAGSSTKINDCAINDIQRWITANYPQ